MLNQPRAKSLFLLITLMFFFRWSYFLAFAFFEINKFNEGHSKVLAVMPGFCLRFIMHYMPLVVVKVYFFIVLCLVMGLNLHR